MKYSIICPTKNNIFHLVQALESIRQHTMDYEIIVVGHNCSDASDVLTASYNGKYIPVSDTKITYSGLINKGLELATGDYIIIISDDIIVSSGWAENLLEGANKVSKQYNIPVTNLVVSPVFNYADSMFLIQTKDASSSNVATLGGQIQKVNNGKHSFVNSITSNCVCMPRNIFQSVGYFDEEFEHGGEDKDYGLRILEKGFNIVVMGDTYVYKTVPYSARQRSVNSFLSDVPKLIEKYQKDKNHKLGVGYKINITSEVQEKIFVESLNQIAQIADEIYILDLNPSYKNGETWESVFKNDRNIKIHVINRNGSKFEENTDFNQLLNKAKKDGITWWLGLNSNEIFENKVNRTYIERLMNNPNPAVLGYKFNDYEFTNSSYTHWVLGSTLPLSLRMARIFPNSSITEGLVPTIPSGSCRVTSARVKCYNSPGFIPSNSSPKEWVEDNSISITTIMKDEEYNLYQYMDKYFAFADEVVLVDTGSADKSIEAAKFLGAVVYEYNGSSRKLADYRNWGLQKITTDWLLQLDLDEQLDRLDVVRRMIDASNVQGYLFCIENFHKSGEVSLSETVRLFKNKLSEYYGNVHETIDTNGATIYWSPIRIKHYGYLRPDSIIFDKMCDYLERNLSNLVETPDDPKPYHSIGMHLMEEGYYDLAEICFKKAIKLNPQYFQPRNQLACLYLDKAKAEYDIVGQLLPKEHPTKEYAEKMVELIGKCNGKLEKMAPGHVKVVMKRNEELVKRGLTLIK